MKKRLSRTVANLVLAIACCGPLMAPADAQEVEGLQPESPKLDAGATTAAPAGPAAMPPLSETNNPAPTLYGGVNKSGFSRGLQESQNNSLSAAYDAVLQKLAARQELTSDDYRSLHIGVYGYEMVRLYFQPQARVTKVFPGCPAAAAGIQIGDMQLVSDAANDAKLVDTSRPSWLFNCGTEGQSTDVTIKRDGQLLQFHLVRMNIEDIPDARLRRNYERMVQLTSGTGGIIQSGAPLSTGAILRALMGF